MTRSLHEGGWGGSGPDHYDVAIVGGGPAGSTCATLLKKYNPALRVVIVEKEAFPRDHIGESQLPSISGILQEMGAWEKVEAAGFPIKIGASYTWGRNNDRWDFDFYPVEDWVDEPRPAKYSGQRSRTAFQVDRAIYDKILLDHARELGAEVLQPERVTEIPCENDRVLGLKLESGRTISARYYVDASGTVGILRRAVGVGCWAPEELQNIAVWDYWRNAEWAVEIGVGATRVQVRSLPYGWIWFIPLGPDRTSVGLICPANYYKSTGKRPEDLYLEALAAQPDVAKLIKNARREGPTQSCKDWSQLTDRLVGDNWFIIGESAGFADPILAAGMSLAHSSGREAAYTMLELDRGEVEAAWLKERYNERNRTNVQQHIRFAQYWYSANSCFTDLREHCQKIARDAGLKLQPQQAWQWLSQGGFTSESLGTPVLGSFDISTTRQILELFDPKGAKTQYMFSGYNVFKLNLNGAKKVKIGDLRDGRIHAIDAYERAGRRLALVGYYKMIADAIGHSSDFVEMMRHIESRLGGSGETAATRQLRMSLAMQALDSMIQEYWVTRDKNSKRPVVHASNDNSRFIRWSTDADKAIARAARKPTLKVNI